MINHLNIKRQPLADLLAGKTNELQTYRSQQQQQFQSIHGLLTNGP